MCGEPNTKALTAREDCRNRVKAPDAKEGKVNFWSGAEAVPTLRKPDPLPYLTFIL
jgi:hypothetical protein